MAINLDIVDVKSGPHTESYDWKDTVLYALGVGAKVDELDFLLELSGPKVLPTFAVVPSFRAMLAIITKLGASVAAILHGEQKIIVHRPIPPQGTMTTVAAVSNIYDKGKGALVVIEANTTDGLGEPLFDNVFSVFVRGEGGFGGDRGPVSPTLAPPTERAPNFEVTESTSPEQALLYRLSGDTNPLHASPQLAVSAGFDRPILHGLCTYGYAGRAILHRACGGNPARFRSFAARFSGVVFPGDTLTTRGWRVEEGKYIVEVTAEAKRVVISNSVAEVAP